jgi:hypothetical protein
MAKQTTDFRIASQEKKAAKVFDLMHSGTGIPWEDRGSRGFLSAFFATVFAMMFGPAKTLSKLRRPETATDAKIFSYAIAGIWFIAYCLQSTFNYYCFYNNDPKLEIDGQQYVINTGLGAVLCAVGAVVLSRVVSWMFYRLTAFDMTTKAPPVLVYNSIVYLMSPSILALIPGGPKPWLMIAPCVVGVWIFIQLLVVAISYLRIRIGASIIGSFLTFLATTIIVVGGITAVNLIWNTLLDKGAVEVYTSTSVGR